ncbi:MAG: 2-dehydro-3-deoxyphosphooctonate aldolase [Fimbriimonadales bacterium]|nr:MAG: 2-dehydro-3-deoxyphosphooctonate aldolase [Fimbriimonadales bacterium]
MHPVSVGEVVIGEGRLCLIAGPCVIERLELCQRVAEQMTAVCQRLGVPYIFKASFDKANRTAHDSFRGEGLDAGLEVLARIRREFAVPVTTDIHESWQAVPTAQVVDLLQIPAFLCRQTDLLQAAARTGKPVNVKKGQFLAPWDTGNIVEKLRAFGAVGVLLTERGTSFGYNTLIVDMAGLPIMRRFGAPIVFDATHSVQRPGGAGKQSGGHREAIEPLARAAVAVGIDALFMEVHPDPSRARSDAATQYPLEQVEPLLWRLLAIHNAARG